MPDIPRIAGVRFRNAGKIFYFDTAGMRLETGEHVIVETARGPELARVVIAPDQVVVNELGREDLKPILRLATAADIQKANDLQQRAQELLPEARRLAGEAGFRAHIEAAEFTLDGRRLTFSFTSEERLDYREFIRAASRHFDVKTDMRQVGARDRAKLAGGYGICGRELCCSNWLTTFPSISIRMAKEQDLPLNPQKISGLCGRLLCCLSYEEEGYKQMRKSLPKVGQRCSTPTGEGKAISVNILRRQVTLLIEGQRIEVPDRDLGTVVRWDTASKSGEPPASITREEGIAQGLIEADEIDLRGDGAGWPEANPYEVDAGRGRLPVPAARREAKPHDPVKSKPGQGEADARARSPKAGEGQRQARGRRNERQQQGPRGGQPASLPERRIFKRTESGRPNVERQGESPAANQPPAASDGQPRRRRRRRGGRGPSGPTET
jgi:cell fate regulator YaaT (PSP1 superfamily)